MKDEHILQWVTCQDWLDWINDNHYVDWQPMLKEDRKSILMSLEDRISRKTIYNPALPAYKRRMLYRYFYPKGLEQIINFIGSKGIPFAVGYNKIWQAKLFGNLVFKNFDLDELCVEVLETCKAKNLIK